MLPGSVETCGLKIPDKVRKSFLGSWDRSKGSGIKKESLTELKECLALIDLLDVWPDILLLKSCWSSCY